jgi:hypothetical protein
MEKFSGFPHESFQFVLGVLTSWPLLVSCIVFFYRREIGQLVAALTEKIRKSSTVKLPGGMEFSDADNTMTSLAQDVLELKNQMVELVANKSESKQSTEIQVEREDTLEQLIYDYDERTKIPDYSQRMSAKTSILERMELATRATNTSLGNLLKKRTEGAFLAIAAFSRQLPPDEAFYALVEAGKLSEHLFVRNALLFKFVERSTEADPPCAAVVAARQLVSDYETDKHHRPDPTFVRNLIYYKQVLNRLIHSTNWARLS